MSATSRMHSSWGAASMMAGWDAIHVAGTFDHDRPSSYEESWKTTVLEWRVSLSWVETLGLFDGVCWLK